VEKRLERALGHSSRTETTVLLEEPGAFDADMMQEDEAAAKAEAECPRPVLTMFTDVHDLIAGQPDTRSHGKMGGAGWGIKTHGYDQKTNDAECAALVRALETAAGRQTTPERVTIFTGAQAAIRRKASNEPGPRQFYVIQARKHIATLRRARPGIIIEIRW
jgi:hypothetical protein